VNEGELVLQRDDAELLYIRVDRAETTIGRHLSNDVVIPDESLPDVSGLLIDFGAGRFKIRDMSRGAMKINRQQPPTDEEDIRYGDQLTFGVYTVLVRKRAPDRLPTPAQGSPKTAIMPPAASGEIGAEASTSGHLYLGEKSFVMPTDRPFNIGGDDDCDLVLQDAFISSFHSRIALHNGRWTVFDLASTNGTMVNGLRVREAELPPVASIQIGRTALRFEIHDKSASTSQSGVEVYAGMIARAPTMRKVFDQVRKLADVGATVLIEGPSGSGKELVARALHDAGKRRNAPYLPLNCGALQPSLIESELFGHEKGAFTGAGETSKGAFQAAQGGTIFLDEIGELPIELQPKLLRVLETQRIRKVGGTVEIPIDVRVIAATHRNLGDLVREGSFREDLFHRLYVLNIEIPPLRDRREDIMILARHFLTTGTQLGKHGAVRLSPEAEEALIAHDWPGNVRELRNVIMRAVLSCDGPLLDRADFKLTSSTAFSERENAQSMVRQADVIERARILEALDKAGQNRAEAARFLGVSKSTFHDRLKRYGIPLKSEQRRY